MSDRDQELSRAADALITLLDALAQPDAERGNLAVLARIALGHVEDAAEMPKPSRIRTLLPWRKRVTPSDWRTA